MTRRLAKEFRTLALPCAIAAAAGAGMHLVGPTLWSNGLLQFLVNLLPFVFTVSLTAAAALSFGNEFQHGTLAGLMAQPMARTRIWAEKLGVVAATTFVVGLISSLAWLCVPPGTPGWAQPSSATGSDFGPPVPILLFLLATVCSTGFWSLVAGSTLGGVVFTLSAEFFVFLGLHAIYGYVAGPGPNDWNGDAFFRSPIVPVAAVLYSGVFLWLGWRRFLHLELRQMFAGARGEAAGGLVLGEIRQPQWLRWQGGGPLSNLLRKELHLQKPAFLLATLYCLCWLATIGLILLEPGRTELFQSILAALAGLYIPLTLIVAGCISLGEENGLGVREWHLTLPISGSRQWWVKLAVTIGLGVGLAMVLPGALAWFTAGPAEINFRALGENQQDISSLACVGLACLVASFWASTMVANTVRAALSALILLVVAGGCTALGAWGAHVNGGVEAGLLNEIMIRWHLPPHDLAQSAATPVSLCAFGIVLLVALRQSRQQFVRVRAGAFAMRLNGVVLAAVVLVASFWAFDFQESVFRQRDLAEQMLNQVQQAMMSLPTPKPGPAPGYVRPIFLRDLLSTRRISPETAQWLSKANIYVRVLGNMNEVTLEFVGHGQSVVLNFQRGVHGGM
jgi:hypothetical protein